MKRLRSTLAALLIAATVLPVSAASSDAPKVREPVVAGSFYPKDAATLSRTIDTFLNGATTQRSGQLKALICPHAGYQFSGPIAGSGFRLLRGLEFKTVILLGPSHYAVLATGSVSDANLFRTPLGDVPISAKSRTLAGIPPFALNPTCEVEAPPWTLSARSAPNGRDRADSWEHADEVEVPFLQKTLGAFELVPVIMGEVDTDKAASALERVLDDNTLIVVSSDLSHYFPYPEARRLDERCVNAICALNIAAMQSQEACGRIPIVTLLRIAKSHGWHPQLLDLRNSGDTAGDKSRVVGYAAIAFYARESGAGLSDSDRRYLLDLARRSLNAATSAGNTPAPPAENVPATLAVRKGAFVTLTKHGDLRGCIGNIMPQGPLYEAVAENTRRAALKDPRFPPVTAGEADQLSIEISVLTEPQPLAFDSPADLVGKLHPGEDGVVLRIGAGTATYLPQVWREIPDKIEFLNSLAEKAGGRLNDWCKPGTTVSIYQVESFHEASP
jgi:MEMO1 family protein